MVDLHGLYVAEALEYAELAFELGALEDDKIVRFIVGTSSPRVLKQVSNGSRRIQAKDYMRRMARRKFGRRWKISVKSTFGISDCSHSPFCFLPWSILGAALHTIWIPRMLEFLLSIVEQRVSWMSWKHV